MKILASLVLMAVSGCLTGCHVGLMPAKELFGDAAQAPKLKVKKTWTGFSAEASSDFSGTFDGTYRPETGEVSVKAAVASTASSVLDKYPEWIGSMGDIRKAEITANIEINRMQLEKWKATADVARALGEAGIGVVGEMVKVLPGSTLDITTPFGGVAGTLGVPPVPVVVPPPPGGSMTTTTIIEPTVPTAPSNPNP